MLSSNASEARPVRSGSVTIATYVLVVIAVLLAMFLVVKVSLAEKAQSAEAVQRSGTLMQVAALRQNVFEAESAVQRYLLLGKEEYLTEYRELAAVIERRLLDMKSAAGVDTRQRACLESLATHLHRRFSLMDSWIEVANKPALRGTLVQTADDAVEEAQTIKRLLMELEGEQYRALARTRADR